MALSAGIGARWRGPSSTFMEILLLHPNDRADEGPWRDVRWDWIVDLGWAGQCAYAELSDRLGCRAFSVRESSDHALHLSRLREFWQAGIHQLIDEQGLDWWDIFFPLPYTQMEQIMLLFALDEQIPKSARVTATRSHFMVQALSTLLGRKIGIFVPESHYKGLSLLARRIKAASAFTPPQLGEIALDKWDSDYRFRRHISPKPKKSSEPAILLPSSYVNVSRAQVAYARMLPQQRFLLAVTRRNGGLVDLPANVELRSLASYAPLPFPVTTEKEYERLIESWCQFQSTLSEASSSLRLASKIGVFDGFPAFLKKGLRIRDAWRALLSGEPICGVLSGDENNPFTRLPTLLARSKGINTVVCEHGALNVGFALRPAVSAVCLAQGEMGRDYWIEFCGMKHSQMLVGSAAVGQPTPGKRGRERDWIVFFSEPYELNSGRTEDFYKEILPKLCSLASQTNRKVIVKLHPYESLRARSRLVKRSLLLNHQSLVELRKGPLTPDLFERAWFGVTVESSVTVECALKGVPCFLCRWLDCSWSDYGTQFVRFSAGHIMSSPEAILDIPKRLQKLEIGPEVLRRLATQICPDYLQAILLGTIPGQNSS